MNFYNFFECAVICATQKMSLSSTIIGICLIIFHFLKIASFGYLKMKNLL